MKPSNITSLTNDLQTSSQAFNSLRRVLAGLLDETSTVDSHKRTVILESLDYLGGRISNGKRSDPVSFDQTLHDMKGSLNTIQAAAQLLQRTAEVPASSRENKEYLEVILDCVGQLSQSLRRFEAPKSPSRAA